MSDTKTTPAPAACPFAALVQQSEAAIRGALLGESYVRAEANSLSGFLAQLRAADARSARRFEGL